MVPRILQVALLALLLSGCKIFIQVPANGSVTTESGVYNCAAEKTCDVDVVDLFFNEVFIAVPDTGYVFAEWEEADRSFCGGSRENCRLRTSAFEGNDLLMNFLSTEDEIFYLTPVFVDPNSEDFTQLRLSGTWDYVQNWGDCSATGQIEQFLDSSGGVYQTYTVESQRVTSIDPCSSFTAGQSPTRTVGPVFAVNEEPLSVYEIEDAYRENPGLLVTVEVLSKTQYSVSITRDGEVEMFTYTRFVDGPVANF